MKILSVLVVGIAIGFFLGNTYSYDQVVDFLAPGLPQQTSTAPKTKTVDVPSTSNAVTASSSSKAPVEADVTISTSALSDSQRAILSKLGIDADRVTITPEMVSCAYEKLGEARVKEIVDGAEPSAFELLKVAPCL